jgi:hypothetical protein
LLKRTDPLLVCELARRACTKARVRTDVIIVVPPRGDDLARFPETQEDDIFEAGVLIEARVTNVLPYTLWMPVLDHSAGDLATVFSGGKDPHRDCGPARRGVK